jgi:hypothetical protein
MFIGIGIGVPRGTALSGAGGAGTFQELARSTTPVSTSSVSFATLASVVLPANLLGLNGILRIESIWSHAGGTAQTFQVLVKLGAGVNLRAPSPFAATNLSFRDTSVCYFRNSTLAKIAGNSGTTPYGALPNANIIANANTSIDLNITFQGNIGAASVETCVLEAYVIDYLYGA